MRSKTLLCHKEEQIQNEFAEGVREEFVRYFAKSQLKNEPVIDGEKATVDILFGPDGDKEETLEMVKKNGKWYLLSF